MKADISFHFDEFFIILTWSLGRLLAARCSAEVDDLQRSMICSERITSDHR